MFKYIFSLFFLTLTLTAHVQAESIQKPKLSETAYELLSRIPLQNGGRLKPLDSYARDSVLFIAERKTLRGDYSELKPLEVILSWLDNGKAWSERKFVYVGNVLVKRKLDLNTKENLFSPEELAKNPKLQSEMEILQKKQAESIKLDSVDQGILRVVSKLELFQAIATGVSWTLLPQKKAWLHLSHEATVKSAMPELMSGILACAFQEHSPSECQGGLPYVQELASRQALEFLKLEKDGLEKTEGHPAKLMDVAQQMNREVFFNKAAPFKRAWMLYILSALFFAMFFYTNGKKTKKSLLGISWGLYLLAFFIHSFGFGLRCLLTERPPVTNMYESTIWVPWGVVFFSILITLISRKFTQKHMIAAAAALVAGASLLLSDNVPAVLDPTIKPLEPVLRSNYWLTIHVLTITLSYGAFALSMGLGNIALYLYGMASPSKKENIPAYTQFMYRAVQFGVVFLAAGTILGGIWADYSWGRFWGWDPKETWALIALLMYVTILHGKWSGWLKQFGITIGTVLCFMGVLMAWYGVNFVLGVGLHSYGFSSGGLEFLAVYVFLQLAFAGLMTFKYLSKTKKI